MSPSLDWRQTQTIPALGLGCWAIGGPYWADAIPLGLADTDDSTAKSALKAALDHGIQYFDVADVYGAGHAEELLGSVLKRRDDVLIATKFGHKFDATTKQVQGKATSADDIREAVHGSLRRLKREQIDLYELHLEELDADEAGEVADELDRLVQQGKIAAYGWVTDHVSDVENWAGRDDFAAVQHEFNLLHPANELREKCAAHNLVSVCRAPFAMGLLSHQINYANSFGDADSVPEHLAHYLKGDDPQTRLEKIHDLLRTDGRTIAQGALGWIWATDSNALPIPGFRTADHVKENAKALELGPLPDDVVDELNALT
ncbi:aldo/keto reductase [Maritalea mediterranea]|uniref:Aldo/keto reductase n=1 Tax=Maritalea mediterranea TaxID=2909667 RepID=A0ABS9E9I5_9HYPH|nr:aldo/keto reductase [Maritalea mediterranea]MCF4098872.1 aldo/keto reductase [Maritalea mediterranea]